jgi:beta-mannosidase
MWYEVSKKNRELYKQDYVKLYIDTVHAAVKEVDPMVGVGRGWVDSSPSNGVVSEEPYVKRWQMPNLWEYGDVHHYDYFHDCEDYKVYPQPRFVSEHGFQSWPAFAILKNLTEADDWSRDSAFFDYRQRHQNGNMVHVQIHHVSK